jgi:hypothetical protein
MLAGAMLLAPWGASVFIKNEIVDWMYTDAGTMKGNYSARAILKLAPPQGREAFKWWFGLYFDF